MKVNILDVCHETISDESDESLVLSIKMISGLEGETRVNINYNDNLVQFCASEMKDNNQVRDFFLRVTDLYFQQDI